MVMACSHDLQLLQSLQGVVLQFLKSRKLAVADKGPERMITYEQDPVSCGATLLQSIKLLARGHSQADFIWRISSWKLI